jgi:hypothetical protein
MSNAETRAQLIRTISDNLSTFAEPEHIEALFHVTCDDLIAGGVDAIRVKAAMLRAFVRQQIAVRGAPATADLLRDFADLIERPSLHNSQNFTLPN